jgi:hypothetical protein
LNAVPFIAPFQHHGRTEAAQAQPGDQRGGLPMPPWYGCGQAFTTSGAATQPGHVRFGAGFVDENKAFWLQPSLPAHYTTVID